MRNDGRIVASAHGDALDIELYGYVGGWGDEITACGVLSQIKGSTASTLNVRIFSSGGDVFEGLAIYNLLRSHPARKVVTVDGIAASIASVIACAGDEVLIPENAFIMVHEPEGAAFGGAEALRKRADLIDQTKEALIDAYAAKSGKDRETIAGWMREETWFAGAEAVEAGLADKVTGEVKLAACADVDLAAYRHVPAALRAVKESTMDPTSKERQTILARLGALIFGDESVPPQATAPEPKEEPIQATLKTGVIDFSAQITAAVEAAVSPFKEQIAILTAALDTAKAETQREKFEGRLKAACASGRLRPADLTAELTLLPHLPADVIEARIKGIESGPVLAGHTVKELAPPSEGAKALDLRAYTAPGYEGTIDPQSAAIMAAAYAEVGSDADPAKLAAAVERHAIAFARGSN